MRVMFHGVRGSVPAPGPETARYGGNTSCVEVRLGDGTLLVFDAGTGIRKLGEALFAEGAVPAVHLLLSHTHWDHILGLPFFAPLWHPDTSLSIYPLASDAQERFQRTIFDDIHFPVSANDIPARVEFARPIGSDWRIGSARVRRIQLNHPGGAQGFRVDDDDASFAYLTDNELSASGAAARVTIEELARFSEGVDLLIHDSQYVRADMPAKQGWGHSLVDEVLRLGVLAAPRRLALYHHDPNRTDDELDAIARQATTWMGGETKAVEVLVAREGLKLELS
ncbi:MAG: MBL fold metallo-hydrolase [Sorangiineae bacterium]|nr:MBL fold metallo-hydrolase [Polyangiaceae bacterium]MEB2324202.1 MBL fold metallo-hydrolase [Sorangiineae bacterium]